MSTATTATAWAVPQYACTTAVAPDSWTARAILADGTAWERRGYESKRDAMSAAREQVAR